VTEIEVFRYNHNWWNIVGRSLRWQASISGGYVSVYASSRKRVIAKALACCDRDIPWPPETKTSGRQNFVGNITIGIESMDQLIARRVKELRS
jgi:hypothetical protein